MNQGLIDKLLLCAELLKELANDIENGFIDPQQDKVSILASLNDQMRDIKEEL